REDGGGEGGGGSYSRPAPARQPAKAGAGNGGGYGGRPSGGHEDDHGEGSPPVSTNRGGGKPAHNEDDIPF
ncbi:MAG: hypothetical protein K2W96_07630, partial [Gemmataceae bacterium]|nr:hypothetical protein [Gemmataceae bacterium]